MLEKANEYAKADDAVMASKQSGSNWKSKKDTPTAGGSGSGTNKDRKRKPKDLVATAAPSSHQRSHINTFDKIMNAQCSHHANSNHAAKVCFVYKQFAEQYAKQGKKPTDGEQSTSKKKDDDDYALSGYALSPHARRLPPSRLTRTWLRPTPHARDRVFKCKESTRGNQF